MRLALAIALVPLTALATGAQPPAPAPDAALRVVAGRLVVDSLRLRDLGGSGKVLVAGDSATARLLLDAGGPAARVDPRSPVFCAGSAGADSRAVTREAGYELTITLAPRADPAEYEVRAVLACQVLHRGQPRGYAEGHAWVVRRVAGQWRVVRTLGGWVT